MSLLGQSQHWAFGVFILPHHTFKFLRDSGSISVGGDVVCGFINFAVCLKVRNMLSTAQKAVFFPDIFSFEVDATVH